MTDDVKAVIEKLAVALHTTADEVWEILVWQGRAGAVGNLVECVVPILLIFLFLTKWGPYLWAYAHEEKHQYEELPSVVLVIGAVLTIMGAVILPFVIGDQVVRFINPQYWALREILDVVKK